MRWLSVCTAALLAAGLGGCVPAEQQRDTDFKLQKAEKERDACRQTLNDERAKATALSERLKVEQRERAAAQAELSSAREQTEVLRRKNDELLGTIEQRASAPLARPEVPVSPLPPAVDQALQGFSTKFQNRVWYERGRGAVSFANDQLFEPGGDTVRADAHAALHELAGVIGKTLTDEYDVIVVGHTDDSPITKEETRAKHATNWDLSVHRALAVRDVLEQAGVPAARLAVMGYGQYRPLGGDPARNRRVEVFLVRKGEVTGFAPVRPPRR